MERGTWQATVHGGPKELDTTERLNTHSVRGQTTGTTWVLLTQIILNKPDSKEYMLYDFMCTKFKNRQKKLMMLDMRTEIILKVLVVLVRKEYWGEGSQGAESWSVS